VRPPEAPRAAPAFAVRDPQNERLPDRFARDLNAEARIQASIVEGIRGVAPELLCFAVPNGGYRTPVEAARMRWTGVLAGVPDLVVIAPGGRAYFLEVKTATGRLSRVQQAVHETLIALGTPPAIVRSIEDARLAFAAWEIGTREARRG
jgi:hypothetical protein